LSLGGGDTFQGTLLSNADYGNTTTRIMDNLNRHDDAGFHHEAATLRI